VETDMPTRPGTFEGCFVAVATPFRGGALDVATYRAHCESLVRAGVAGLVPCGTTGEAATLSPDEYLTCVRVAVEVAHAERRVVIAGAGSNSTARTIESVRAVREAGADAALVVTPYYNRPPQEGLVLHYRSIARGVPGFPLVPYNVPGRTGVDLLPATYEQLAGIPEIVAVKEATGQIGRVTDIRARVGDRFSLLSGDDLTMMAFVAAGGRGVISVSANVAPAKVSQLIAAALARDLVRASALNDELAHLHLALAEGNPMPVKAALHLLGVFSDEVRLPLVPAPGATRDRLEGALARLGLVRS
jgi:4-hydroxy-tetrahydrodipicolinate synthase